MPYIEHDGITHEVDFTPPDRATVFDWLPPLHDPLPPRQFGMRYTGSKQAKARARKAKQRRK